MQIRNKKNDQHWCNNTDITNPTKKWWSAVSFHRHFVIPICMYICRLDAAHGSIRRGIFLVSFEQATSEVNSVEKADAECLTKKVVVYILLHTWSTQNMLKAEPSSAFSLGFYLVHDRASSMTKLAKTRESRNNIQVPAPMSHRNLTMNNAE